MSEALLLRAVLRTLPLNGVMPLRLNAGMTVIGAGNGRRVIKGVAPGTPDVLAVCPNGRVVWLEVKTPRGQVTRTQQAMHERLRALGHRVHVVRSVDEALAAVMEG